MARTRRIRGVVDQEVTVAAGMGLRIEAHSAVIRRVGDVAVRLGDGASLVSEGLLLGNARSVVAEGDARIVLHLGGSISGGPVGLSVEDPSAVVTIDNGDVITGFDAIVSAAPLTVRSRAGGIIAKGGDAIVFTGGTVEVHRWSIVAGHDHAILAAGPGGGPATVPTRIVSAGTIESRGDHPAITLVGDHDDVILSSGTIDSRSGTVAIDAGGGDDRIVNSGIITSAVLLGDGDDVFRGTLGRTLNYVLGGDGDDRIWGGIRSTLIVGGAGRDLLTGGEGQDVFTYRAVTDSPGDRARADRIRGFDDVKDIVDLKSIDADTAAPGDQAFRRIGDAAFSGSAGELRVVAARHHTLIEGDVDGDAVADLMIVLDRAVDPAAIEFLL